VCLLRRHVVDRAECHAGPGQRFLTGPPGDAEVGQESVLFAGAAREQHVAGLDVAVNQTVPVRCLERAGDLTRDRRGASRFEPFLLIEQSTQIEAIHVAHGQVQQPGLLAGVEDLNYVGVIQSSS
jgi:hypothetical protein